MFINGQQRHITQGIRHHASLCAIALAVRDHLGSDIRLEVTCPRLRISKNRDPWKQYRLPAEAGAFIKSFDRGKRVKPCGFIAEPSEM